MNRDFYRRFIMLCPFYPFLIFFQLFFDNCFFFMDSFWRTYNLRQSLDETDRSAHSGRYGFVMKPITSSNLFSRWSRDGPRGPRWSPEVPKTDNLLRQHLFSESEAISAICSINLLGTAQNHLTKKSENVGFLEYRNFAVSHCCFHKNWPFWIKV